MESETTPLRPIYDSYSSNGSNFCFKLRKIRCCNWLTMSLLVLLLFGMLIIVIVYKSLYQQEGVETITIGNTTVNDGFEMLPSHVTYPLRAVLPSMVNDSDPLNLTLSDISNITFNDIDYAMDKAYEALNDTELLEKKIKELGLSTKPGSAPFYHQNFRGHPKNYSMGAYRKELASKLLKAEKNISKSEIPKFHNIVDAMYRSRGCKQTNTTCLSDSMFRTIDGSCNNLNHPTWGMSFTPYYDILPKEYDDGISSPRASVVNSSLPSARLVQSALHSPDYYGDHDHTYLLMQFGQFLDHDITATAASKTNDGDPIECCHSEMQKNRSMVHPECYPIEIPADDDFYSQYNQTCMEFVRSAPFSQCEWGPRKQFNTITHFIDGSNIYGSTLEESLQLRELKDGLLKVNKTVSGDLLPSTNPENNTCDKITQLESGHYCFRSGDSRVNEVIFLTAMHTVWVRQHNKVAGALKNLNINWDDEKIYQESRRIVIAMMQHITYYEYLPIILGKQTLEDEIYSKTYDPEVNPSVASAFAGAAFRFGHSQVQGLVELLYKGLYTGQYNIKIKQLHEFFFHPQELYERETLDGLIKGGSVTKPRQVGRHFTPELTNHLFQPAKASYGLDLISINIQRGRDHGLAGYTSWRNLCGLRNITSFDDLQPIFSPYALSKVKELYAHVDDIDLYTGGLAEKPAEGSLVGETFLCILTDGFLRLKIGDRFWYENKNQPYPFTDDQIQEIKKIKLFRILCDNSNDLQTLQPEVFYQIDGTNRAISCLSHTVPKINFVPWEEGSWDKLLDNIVENK